MATKPGFRMVPNWLFLEQVKARRKRMEPFTAIEAWCSMDYDMYRNHELSSERAYAALWKRSREWVRHLMQLFRKERGLPEPSPGRRPKSNGSKPPPPPSEHARDQTISRTVS